MSDMVRCRGCGKEIHRTAAACPQCGASQRTRRYKSKGAAGALALLVGGLGVHRFYLGQWWGIFYLLFCWTYIPALVAIIEGIVILVSDQETWDAKYNEGIPGTASDGAAVVVVAIVAVFVGVAVLGILAAIAIPAYQDYTMRAGVAQAIVETERLRGAVAASLARGGAAAEREIEALARETQQASLYLDSVRLGDGGEVVLRFGARASALANKTLIFKPSRSADGIVWSCDEGTLEMRYRPSKCRR